jgi:hypothetical protein
MDRLRSKKLLHIFFFDTSAFTGFSVDIGAAE